MFFKRKYISRFSIVVLLFIGHNLFGQSQDTLKVLFVGNSYTYFWNMPQTVQAMAESKGKVLMARKSTAGGTTLKQHWNGDKELHSKEMIKKGNWDIVVLQNHSLSSIEGYDDFMEYGGKFIDLVKEYGAKPILYVTWARQYNPLMQEQISKAYATLAKKYNIDYVPVGPIWARVRKLRPDLNLFAEDKSHPSTVGTYLIACTFYHVFTGLPATGLPERVKIKDKNNEDLYLSIMSKETASFIQQAVDEYFSKNEPITK